MGRLREEIAYVQTPGGWEGGPLFGTFSSRGSLGRCQPAGVVIVALVSLCASAGPRGQLRAVRPVLGVLSRPLLHRARVAALVERGPRGYFEGSSQASRRAVVGGPRLASGTSVAKGRPSRGGPPLVAIKPPLVGGSRRLVYVWHAPMACAGSQRPQRRSQQTREARHLGTQLTAQRSPASVR